MVEIGLSQRHLVGAHAIDVVGHAHRDGLVAGQDVELGHHQVGEPVDAGGVAGDDGVVPAATARPPGGDAVLAALGTQALTHGAVQLSGEGSLPHASRVRLDDADDGVDAGRAHAGAGAGAAGGGVGGGDEGVGAVVDVQHRRLTGLEQDGPAGVQRVVEDQGAVDDHGAHAIGVGEQLVGDLIGVDGRPIEDLEEETVLLVERGMDLLTQDRLVEEVLDAQTHAVHLVRIGGSDTATGGAELTGAEEALDGAVQHPVVGGDEVRAGGDAQG